MQDDLNIKLVERLSVVEANQSHLAEEVGKHEGLIDEMKEKMTTLVSEVKQIRNALYFMAAAVAANVPALKDMGLFVIKLLSY